MVNYRQLKSLVKQELRRGMRSQYVIFSFVILPIMMWGIQAGVQYVATSSLDTAGQDIYVLNMDEGNTTNFLGNEIVKQMENLVTNKGSPIFGAKLDLSVKPGTITQLEDRMKSDGISPIVLIPSNFTKTFDAFNITSNPILPKITILGLPDSTFLTLSTQSALNQIVTQSPFTKVSIEKATLVTQQTVTFDGEEGAADPLSGIGFVAFLTIFMAVMAPAAFVSASFAGEKENRTLEALLALPMTRMDIMIGKILAGLCLIVVFAIMNVVGILIFNIIMGTNGIDINAFQFLIISLVLFLTSFVAIGFGIAIASFAKDQKSANTMYQMIMMLPTMLVGFTTLFNGVPSTLDPIYLVPWTHSMAVLMKSIYPQTYASSTITGSIGLDIVFHLSYLLLFVAIFVIIGSKLFNREQVLG